MPLNSIKAPAFLELHPSRKEDRIEFDNIFWGVFVISLLEFNIRGWMLHEAFFLVFQPFYWKLGRISSYRWFEKPEKPRQIVEVIS